MPARVPPLTGSMPGPLANPEITLRLGAPPSLFWWLEVGVVGVMASEVLWGVSVREDGARPINQPEILLKHMALFLHGWLLVMCNH